MCTVSALGLLVNDLLRDVESFQEAKIIMYVYVCVCTVRLTITDIFRVCRGTSRSVVGAIHLLQDYNYYMTGYTKTGHAKIQIFNDNVLQ